MLWMSRALDRIALRAGLRPRDSAVSPNTSQIVADNNGLSVSMSSFSMYSPPSLEAPVIYPTSSLNKDLMRLRDTGDKNWLRMFERDYTW